MAGRLQDRIALIGVTARGIGAGIAEPFLEEGTRIVISDRDPAGRTTAEPLSAKARPSSSNAMSARRTRSRLW
jgi:NAD(P)-dependent dehydrogenase (short-subunit alcohol dehydrogenase family)